MRGQWGLARAFDHAPMSWLSMRTRSAGTTNGALRHAV